jgi:hypothetical protein
MKSKIQLKAVRISIAVCDASCILGLCVYYFYIFIRVPLLKTLNFVLLSAPLLATIILDNDQVTSEFKYNNIVLYP